MSRDEWRFDKDSGRANLKRKDVDVGFGEKAEMRHARE